MDSYESSRRRRSKARERQEARYQRRSPMAARISTPEQETQKRGFSRLPDIPVSIPNLDSAWLQDARHVTGVMMRDAWWHIVHNPMIVRGAALVAVMVAGVYFLSYFITGQIMPNVQAGGIGIGSLTIEEATQKLQTAWTTNVAIQLVVDGETITEVFPEQMGIRMNAEETARAARSVGLKAVPFGADVVPVIEVDFLVAQDYLLDLAEQLDTLPQNAAYEWQDGQVVGIDGVDGHRLDVPLTLETLLQNTDNVIDSRKLNLLSIPLPPDMPNPEPYMEQVITLASSPPRLNGYDPYTNQHYNLSVPPEMFTSWLQADAAQLTIREETFKLFIDEVNRRILNTDSENVRYLALDETIEMMQNAINSREAEINLRVRYQAMDYVVVPGDTGHAISRKTGVPFYEIDQANSGIVWEQLSNGQTVRVPSRDITMPHPPVPHKRIIVDLPTQTLIAFENGQEIRRWLISSGTPGAPTAPGIYQIINHDPVAYGSSNTLCDSAGVVCGQWEMHWFMGIYEVIPGLVNGFHGKVILPNGGLLDGGYGYPTTFGCVMSLDDNAEWLYNWAVDGTVVEIVSPEFQPMSDLGRLAQASL